MESETATFWLVASAIGQAVSAIVIVGLTIFLARTAHGALSESRAQVKASRAAVEESRRAIEEMGRQREVHERATAEMARQREEMVRQREDVRRHALLSSIRSSTSASHTQVGARSRDCGRESASRTRPRSLHSTFGSSSSRARKTRTSSATLMDRRCSRCSRRVTRRTSRSTPTSW